MTKKWTQKIMVIFLKNHLPFSQAHSRTINYMLPVVYINSHGIYLIGVSTAELHCLTLQRQASRQCPCYHYQQVLSASVCTCIIHGQRGLGV